MEETFQQHLNNIQNLEKCITEEKLKIKESVHNWVDYQPQQFDPGCFLTVFQILKLLYYQVYCPIFQPQTYQLYKKVWRSVTDTRV